MTFFTNYFIGRFIKLLKKIRKCHPHDVRVIIEHSLIHSLILVCQTNTVIIGGTNNYEKIMTGATVLLSPFSTLSTLWNQFIPHSLSCCQTSQLLFHVGPPTGTN